MEYKLDTVQVIILIIVLIALWEAAKMLSYLAYLHIRLWYVRLRLEILQKQKDADIKRESINPTTNNHQLSTNNEQ